MALSAYVRIKGAYFKKSDGTGPYKLNAAGSDPSGTIVFTILILGISNGHKQS